MQRKFLILWLQLVKKLLGSNSLNFTIRTGVNQGYSWKFYSNSNNEFVLGTWEQTMQDIFLRFIKQGDSVYDLGAHQGFLAMLASRLINGEGKVYAFEPLPSNFNRMEENIQRNAIKNCVLYNVAVSDSSKLVKFSSSQEDVSNTYIKSSPAFQSKSFVEVKAVSLDELLEKNELTPPDFIKIDVEGAELDVLKGAAKILKVHSPILYLETHNVHNPGIDQACINFLTSLNYKVSEILHQEQNSRICSYILKKHE